ncbi:MAG TPA: CBS domain-containing protein [Thermoplasmata archaeon]|nr:CBS domain-containing protein [Thermoplasmata archaeon]
MVFLIRDLMATEFPTFPAHEDARSCLEELVRRREGYALVVEDGRTVAIVTEWDFIEKVLARGRDPSKITIGEIASRPVKSVALSSPTMDVVEEMQRQGIRRMVVVDGDRTVGVVTMKRIFEAFRKYVDQVSSDIARLQSATP